MIIRESLEHEARKLAEAFVISFGRDNIDPDRFEKIVQKFQGEIQHEIVHFLVAEEKGKIIGLGGETRHSGASYIGFLGVLPGHRNHRIGSTMFQRLLDQSKVHNPTVELFANPGVETLYQKFGFKEEHHAHVFEISGLNGWVKMDVEIIRDSIPPWVLELDRKAMGFDRSRLLNFLIKIQDNKLVCIEQDGFGFSTDTSIGPLVAKDHGIAASLIKCLLSTSSKKIIVPDHAEGILKPYSPKKVQSCLKMTHGKPLRAESRYVLGYHAFATS
ncbi:MAG: GNAT family N-acetyltransferase [Candidatus Odinarchaeota archaeon]